MVTEMRLAVELPALSGREPLGFLAGLGVLRILTDRGIDARLGWDPVTALARVDGAGDVEEILGHLVAAFEELPDGGLMPGLPPELPAKKLGSAGGDPARITPGELVQAVEAQADDEQALRWLRALYTDLALDKNGCCARTLFSAPAGQQTLRSMFEKPTEQVRGDVITLLEQAVKGWRRVREVTGENLDVRASRLAAEQADGAATTYGVPGATWLALASLPLFPLGGDGKNVRAPGWFRARLPRRRLSWVFAWPVWSEPRTVRMVELMVRHPVIRDAVAEVSSLATGRGSASGSVRRSADALGIEAVPLAVRWSPPSAKSAGYLTAAGMWR